MHFWDNWKQVLCQALRVQNKQDSQNSYLVEQFSSFLITAFSTVGRPTLWARVGAGSPRVASGKGKRKMSHEGKQSFVNLTCSGPSQSPDQNLELNESYLRKHFSLGDCWCWQLTPQKTTRKPVDQAKFIGPTAVKENFALTEFYAPEGRSQRLFIGFRCCRCSESENWLGDGQSLWHRILVATRNMILKCVWTSKQLFGQWAVCPGEQALYYLNRTASPFKPILCLDKCVCRNFPTWTIKLFIS